MGGVMVTGRGTEICVFVGADFAGNVSEYDNVLIILWRCSFKDLIILEWNMCICGSGFEVMYPNMIMV